MKRAVVLFFNMMVSLLLASVAFAQEAGATEVEMQGLGTGIMLLGIFAVMVIGVVVTVRSNSEIGKD
ncbi:MAG UNVERIFIED_CONTAM: hypothetical protein LVT10_17115 [Anaerolineae bacterium]|jgi:hypothetical protein